MPVQQTRKKWLDEDDARQTKDDCKVVLNFRRQLTSKVNSVVLLAYFWRYSLDVACRVNNAKEYRPA